MIFSNEKLKKPGGNLKESLEKKDVVMWTSIEVSLYISRDFKYALKNNENRGEVCMWKKGCG